MDSRLQFTVIHTAERRKFKITVRVDDVPNIRVRMLKKSIFQATGIPADCQALYLNKKLLSDRMTGSELSLTSDTVFVLHTSESAQTDQLDLVDGGVSPLAPTQNAEKSRSRSRSRSRNRSKSRSNKDRVERDASESARDRDLPIDERRHTFGKARLGCSQSSNNDPVGVGFASGSLEATDIASTSSPRIASAYAIDRDLQRVSSGRRKSTQSLTTFGTYSNKGTRKATAPSPQSTVAHPLIITAKRCSDVKQKINTSTRVGSARVHKETELSKRLHSPKSKNGSIVDTVLCAGVEPTNQNPPSLSRMGTSQLYSEPTVNYPRPQSKAHKTRHDASHTQLDEAIHSLNYNELKIMDQGGVEDHGFFSEFPEKCSVIESEYPVESPAIVIAANGRANAPVAPLALSRVSLTDLRSSDPSLVMQLPQPPQSLQPEFPTKTTGLTIRGLEQQRNQFQVQVPQVVENASSTILPLETDKNAGVAKDAEEKDGQQADGKTESNSFDDEDIELLREMQVGIARSKTKASTGDSQAATNTELISKLQVQILLMQQEMETLKTKLAPTASSGDRQRGSPSHGSVSILAQKLSNDGVAEADDLDKFDKFRQQYEEEIAALRTEIELLKAARDSIKESTHTSEPLTPVRTRRTSDSCNTNTFQPCIAGKLTPLSSRDTRSPNTTIELEASEHLPRSSNGTPMTGYGKLNDAIQRPSSARAFNISRSQQNSALLAAQNIKQQIDSERDELTAMLQRLEIYDLMSIFVNLELEIANLERENMSKALEESKIGITDVQERLSHVLAKTPTFTPDVRQSAEMSLDYGVMQREYARLQSQMLTENKQRRTLHNTLEDMKGSIRVIVRMRPMLQHEKEELKTSKFKSFNYRSAFIFKDEHTLQLKLPYGIAAQENYSFDFYKILDETKTQENVFHDMSHLLKSVLDGYNVCVLAYGCTGSGKTFTLIGDDSETAVAESVVMSMHKDPHEKNPYERLGLLPRSIVELFNLIEADTSQSQRYEVKCAMIELYLDNILDLFHTEDDTRTHSALPTFNTDKLVIRQTPKGETYIQNLSYKTVANAEELVGYLGFGLERRHIAATRLNSLSSRSHTVFMIEVMSYCETVKGIRTTRSVLTFADLAGSENVTKSHSNGLRLKEAQHINTSLCALGDVIAALSRKKVASYVPYRNNKLTMILQQSLGNNSKTLLFANISPLPNLLYETLSTLSFAGRVKNVKNVAVKNLTNVETE